MIEKIQSSATKLVLPDKERPGEKTEPSFQDTLKEAIQDVNQLQVEAGATTEAFLRGEITDLHDVTIAMEKARLGLELMLEVRNKLVEAYQEIMRMQL
ncbi:MAG: flagellar hook-basal body complex protein FliE [Calditrichaeota bacterium]|nr:MAG: flagellar hook-basal body complex protein FliE [Calditrichota bacterium]